MGDEAVSQAVGGGEPSPDARIEVKVHFTDYFTVDPTVLHAYGAFNVSLVNDLPLFIDPFLLFNSARSKYRALHDDIIQYVRFLRDKSAAGELTEGLLRAWFTFPEVKQTWLGFSGVGNAGAGLGMKFARTLNRNLGKLLTNFGAETITKGSHLEKLCLIDDGVGRDLISDFVTNLIKGYLLRYTQTFAHGHLTDGQRRTVAVDKVVFNYETETWAADRFELPYIGDDYVLLTPRDLLTRDDAWINRSDLVREFDDIVASVPDGQLRAQFSNYLASRLPKLPRGKEPSAGDVRAAILDTVGQFPALLDHYIRFKEDRGEQAHGLAHGRVVETEQAFVEGVRRLVERLAGNTDFYRNFPTTSEEARQRVMFLKRVIEDMDGYRMFWVKGKAIHREQDLHILYRLTWYATLSDVNREVNNGRGPVDFKISRGAGDKTLVEFKLASNKKLEANLTHQVKVYEKANETERSIKVIVFFSAEEKEKVARILKRLGMTEHPGVVLIDARRDNKPSASTIPL
jgi:hypothetical protein